MSSHSDNDDSNAFDFKNLPTQDYTEDTLESSKPSSESDSDESDAFDFSKLPKSEATTTTEADTFDFIELLEKKVNLCKDYSLHQVHSNYADLLTLLPKSTKAPSISDTLTKICCGQYCCLKFSPEFVMRARLLIPIFPTTNQSAFSIVQQFQFYLIQNCIIEDQFIAKINNVPVCKEFFIRLYLLPNNRFQNLLGKILEGMTQAPLHGNAGKTFERESTLKRFAKLISVIDTVAEPHPSGTGYLMPAGMTKTDVVAQAQFDANIMINPSQEIKRIKPTLHHHKANSFTKCKICIDLKSAAQNPRLSAEDRQKALLHLHNHRLNNKLDQRDYYIRKFVSLEEPEQLLSLAADGFSKEKTKFPHLLNNRTKKLADTQKMMCSLNMTLVHKKTAASEYQLHLFWNIDQISGAKANAIISQLFFTISNCETIPNSIAIQLDNCANNKNYTLIGSFAMLLLWIPTITKIYICFSQVGHTHNDVDQQFGLLAKQLKKTEIYTPQGFARFSENKLKAVTGNHLFPPIYDFESVIKTNVNQNGQLQKNHFFELSKDANNTVKIKIARFLRSEKYLKNTNEELSIFDVFLKKPDVKMFPKIDDRNNFDSDNHSKLCQAVKTAMNPTDYEELEALPDLIKNQPKPETFEELLKRIKEKVTTPKNSHSISADIDDESVDTYLERINKIWLSSEASKEEQENYVSSKRKTKKRKTDTTNAVTKKRKVAEQNLNNSENAV